MDTTSFTPGLQSAECSIFDSKLLLGRFFPKDIYYKALMSYPVIAAGLSVIAAQTSYTVIINISHVTAYANNGILSHGNLFFHCNGNGLTIHLHRINCSHSNGTGERHPLAHITKLFQSKQSCSGYYKKSVYC